MPRTFRTVYGSRVSSSPESFPVPGAVSDRWQELYEGQYGLPLRKREIAAHQTFEHMSPLFPDKVGRILDVGAGEGSLLAHLNNSNMADELYAVELSAGGVRAIASRSLSRLVEVQSFDGYHIPYGNDYFDVAYAVHVLEHVEHERQFLREMSRVAKQIVIEVPLEHTLRVKRSIGLCREHGHINLYTPVTLQNLLETTDLCVDQVRLNGNSMEYERFASGPVRGTAKYAIRTGLVRSASRLATSLMTYNATVLAHRTS